MKPRIALVVASESDLGQCHLGLVLLQEGRDNGEIEVVEPCWAASIHRATEFVLNLATRYNGCLVPPTVIITGAGWANHLSGVVDAWLRYHCRNDSIIVVGVAFEDYGNPKHTEVAQYP